MSDARLDGLLAELFPEKSPPASSAAILSHFESSSSPLSLVLDSPTCRLLACRPNPGPLDPARPLLSQLILLTLPPSTAPSDLLHSLVRDLIAPHLPPPHDAPRQKLSELELALRNCTRSSQVDRVDLDFHPDILSASRALPGNRPLKIDDLSSRLDDAHFTNGVQSCVNSWIAQIKKLTSHRRLGEMPEGSTTSEELAFWTDLDAEVKRVVGKVRTPEFECTTAVLKLTRRLVTASSFEELRVLEFAQNVAQVRQFLKEFPVERMLAATDLKKLQEAVVAIFGYAREHVSAAFPPVRMARLFEAVGSDLLEKLVSLLRAKRLMEVQVKEFAQVADEANAVVNSFITLKGQAQVKKIIAVASTTTASSIAPRDQPRHISAMTGLQRRLAAIMLFRSQHEELKSVVAKVLASSAEDETAFAAAASTAKKPEGEEKKFDVMGEIDAAYLMMRDADAIGLTKEQWDEKISRYEEKVIKVETYLIERLSLSLARARDAEDMFRVFSQYNPLFCRPRIKNAVEGYQAQLMSRVRSKIEALQEKYRASRVTQGTMASTHSLSVMRNLPSTFGRVFLNMQISRQLESLLQKVGTVLGADWDRDPEGGQLRALGADLLKQLDPTAIIDEWVKSRPATINTAGTLLTVVEKDRHRSLQAPESSATFSRSAASTKYQLRVNFDLSAFTWVREVRNLRHLKVSVPGNVLTAAIYAAQRYPHVVTLCEVIKTYNNAIARITQGIAPLLASAVSEAQEKLREGAGLTWERLKSVEPYVDDLGRVVETLAEKVSSVQTRDEKIRKTMEQIREVPFEAVAFEEILMALQRTVDDLASLSNLERWVHGLDSTVESALLDRLTEALKIWTTAALVKPSTRETPSSTSQLAITLSVSGREIAVDPSPVVAHARIAYYRALTQGCLAVVCSQKRLRAPVAASSGTELPDATYKSVIKKLPMELLSAAYAAVETRVSEIEAYTKTWQVYQILWEFTPSRVEVAIQDDVGKWQALLRDAAKSSAAMQAPSAAGFEDFGVVSVNFKKVKRSVAVRYAELVQELTTYFSGLMASRFRSLHAELKRAREQLESATVSTTRRAGNLADEAISFVVLYQDLKGKQSKWAEDLVSFRKGQQLLHQSKYFRFPQDWLDVDVVQDEFAAFSEALARRAVNVEEATQWLKAEVTEAAAQIERRVMSLEDQWKRSRPLDEKTKHTAAAEVLAEFSKLIAGTSAEIDKLAKARTALNLTLSLVSSQDKLREMSTELADIGEVWTHLSAGWQSIDGLRESPWRTVDPRKLRKDLEAIQEKLQSLPNKIRQYGVYGALKGAVAGLLKCNLIVTDLRSEAIKQRHWEMLKRKLNASWNLAELTLGQVWDADILQKESVFREVITLAGGEQGLEEFLRQVREHWQAQQKLDLVAYQKQQGAGGKCKLVRNWEELLTKCSEHLTSLSAMKSSPFFKEFAEECAVWEDKLTRLHDTFESWADVQRRWVYLEGVFSAGVSLLPHESDRFRGVDAEFTSLARKAEMAPVALDLLAIDNVRKTLTRLAEILARIQKALGDFLERQRVAFPRFYFLGDEDLLEVIGNPRDTGKIQRHLKKLFTGIAALILDESASSVLGVASSEAEELRFSTPVKLTGEDGKWLSSDRWLSQVEEYSKVALASLLGEAIKGRREAVSVGPSASSLMGWVEGTVAQLVVIAVEIEWCRAVETSMGKSLDQTLSSIVAELELLADVVLCDMSPTTRRKCEHLMATLVHQRDITRALMSQRISDPRSFEWLSSMRYYYVQEGEKNSLSCLKVSVADVSFTYGWEYLGVCDFIVSTPLIDKVNVALTQALGARMGGNPFGPAGTGKTEAVKALGHQLGKHVVVFCCDEGFSSSSMGRILTGLCLCGSFGCFDEFNRLDERTLSAVSQQVQAIQEAIRSGSDSLELMGEGQQRIEKLDRSMGVFITMNPGYAGRSALPDNLKQLFRGVAMVTPDREAIAQVMLFTQGFRTAEILARKVVPLFELFREQLSAQSHYDFGLRALKSVLTSAGNLNRQHRAGSASSSGQDGSVSPAVEVTVEEREQDILIRSVCETAVPKLVSEDVPLLYDLVHDVFPRSKSKQLGEAELRARIVAVCASRGLCAAQLWMDKLIQLNEIQNIHHGLMLVGASGTGKSTARCVLLEAMSSRDDGVTTEQHVIDPKSLGKEQLFGTLDPTTREWTDGVFTATLRKVIASLDSDPQQPKKKKKKHWIVFDGDVDPAWCENLNSVLDDNRLLTLPSGERLALPRDVRIVFEVQDLRSATLATVSRCGMIWFSEDTVSPQMLFSHFLQGLRSTSLVSTGQERALDTQRVCADALAPWMVEGGVVDRSLVEAATKTHIMDFTPHRALSSLFSLLKHGVRTAIERTSAETPIEAALPAQAVAEHIGSWLIFSIPWSLGGSMSLADREEFSKFVHSEALSSPCSARIRLPPLPSSPSESFLDYGLPQDCSGIWHKWTSVVQQVDVESHKVGSPDVVVPTVDTTRHTQVLRAWLLGDRSRPLILCGPPGSGKTMTLQSTLSAMSSSSDIDVATLNFSSATTPELLLRTFSRFCECKKVPGMVDTMVMAPPGDGRWLVVFCDEINLPQPDRYGTQRVITFMRQLIECGGFWRLSPQDKTWCWVRLERVQFVGACNPPTDPGRVPLGGRFLRHSSVILVDFPSDSSLKQIYGTFLRAVLRQVGPRLRAVSERLTEATVEWSSRARRRFTPDVQSHYVFSPRELSRWVRALHEVLKRDGGSDMELADLVLLWAHEGLRLYGDRLVDEPEKVWLDGLLRELVSKYFPEASSACTEALGDGSGPRKPLLFCDWTSKQYRRVELPELRAHVKSILRVFCEEELDVQIVLFNEVLEHILRIDRVLTQPQGHALLVGVSGGGKSLLSRFVAWKNALSIFSIKVNGRYKAADFDNDLRSVMRRSGCQGEKICFIFDESNALDSSFLEKMNTLLAAGEVPGLFEGDEWTSLIHSCRDAVSHQTSSGGSQSPVPQTEDELYRWFVEQVRRNLHVVFTMNPANSDFHNRAATSPALFNRCVIDWFGEWSPHALYQVGLEFTASLDLNDQSYHCPEDFVFRSARSGTGSADEEWLSSVLPDEETRRKMGQRQAVVASLVHMHLSITEANERLLRSQGRRNYVTPRHFLDLISHFTTMSTAKRSTLEEDQLRLNLGLDRLLATEKQVEELQAELRVKSQQLAVKEKAANDKLAQMVKDQEVAEHKRKDSISLQAQVSKQREEIRKRKEVADNDLLKAEPALQEAQRAVTAIKRQDLNEVKSLPNPPKLVCMTMECVTFMLTGKTHDWASIRRILTENTFIPSVVNFKTDALTEKMRHHVNSTYLSDPKFTQQSVDFSSKACGPLYKWIVAQLGFSEIKERVEPLRQEAAALQKEADRLQEEADALKATVGGLERSIEQYKKEYAALISDSKDIETEIKRVQSKVGRSVALVSNLSDERQRWELERRSFQQQLSTLVGNCVLCSGFLSYLGVFDQRLRDSLVALWKRFLSHVGVNFRQDLLVVDFMSTPDQRLQWQAHTLPADDLCSANAVMLEHFNRYPLVIDPSGQALDFLTSMLKEKKVAKTSFLDASFMKHLESALRFGYPLVVQDVETIDPVLNPVLNKEVHKKAGRVLVRLGDQEVDLSPAFSIFLFTRDPTAQFTPDLCSRVTLVNFTVTQSSLQDQCLHKILCVQSPETHARLAQLAQSQGQFRIKLRELQQRLLYELSQAKGNNLLDDAASTVLSTLESLKKEAGDIVDQVRTSEQVMSELERANSAYRPVAMACSRLYFAMEELSQVHFLYQFSLQLFLSLFSQALSSASQQATPDSLTGAVFGTVFRRVCQTLLHEDFITFGLRVAIIRLKSSPAEISDAEAYLLFSSSDLTRLRQSAAAAQAPPPSSGPLATLLSAAQWSMTSEIGRQAPSLFQGLDAHILAHQEDWASWLSSHSTDRQPAPWLSSMPAGTQRARIAFAETLLAKILRPDRLVSYCAQFISLVLSSDGLLFETAEPDIRQVRGSSAPIMLCSKPGFDASGKVMALSTAEKKPCLALAVGSEGFGPAEKAIAEAARQGTWVLLKNVHLAPQWLVQLEKKLNSLTAPSPAFRLFLTSEINPNLPASLLRHSDVLTFEPSPGVLSSLRHALHRIPSARMDRVPIERSRLYLLLCWLHAVVTERLRYVPHGWTKTFEFGEMEQRGALDTIDAWLDIAGAGSGRSNIDPEKIPWAALRSLLCQALYGGRVDNAFDQRLLSALVDRLFVPSCFDSNFPLIPAQSGGGKGIFLPETTKHADCLAWVDSLAATEGPSWLGLPANADVLLMRDQGRRVLRKVLKMCAVSEDQDAEAEEEKGWQKTKAAAGDMVTWLRNLCEDVKQWLSELPQVDVSEKRQQHKPADIADPVARCLQRDREECCAALRQMREDLVAVQETAVGKIKQTNRNRAITDELAHGQVPRQWRRYPLPDTVSVLSFIRDFKLRHAQLQSSASGPLKTVWIGGLLHPEAFLTATRQAAARASKRPLEELQLTLSSLVPSSSSQLKPASSASESQIHGSFAISGMTLENASVTSDSVLSLESSAPVPVQASFSWAPLSSPPSTSTSVSVPVYLNECRTDLVCTVDVRIPSDSHYRHWHQRSAALCCWRSSS